MVFIDYMTYNLDLQKKLIRSRWIRNLNSKEYRQGLLFVLKTIEEQNLEYWLYDSSRHSAPDISDQFWLADVFTPQINNTSIRRVAAILPHDIILQTVVEKIYTRSKPHKRDDILFETFHDLVSAEEWLLSQHLH